MTAVAAATFGGRPAAAGGQRRRPPSRCRRLKRNQVAQCDADADDSRRRARRPSRTGIAPGGRPLHVRRRRAVRAAVSSDAVLRAGRRSRLAADGEEVVDGLPVQYRYEGNIFSGEKRIGPAGRAGGVGARVSPEIAIIPTRSIRAAQPGPTGATRRGRARRRAAARCASPWSTMPRRRRDEHRRARAAAGLDGDALRSTR